MVIPQYWLRVSFCCIGFHADVEHQVKKSNAMRLVYMNYTNESCYVIFQDTKQYNMTKFGNILISGFNLFPP